MKQRGISFVFAGPLVLVGIVLLFILFPASAHDPADPSQYVNPFVGTTSGGNTFPGAVRPWGMVSVSPHTDLFTPSGYTYGESWFYGMGHVHLSGTGCADLGSVLVTAARGQVRTSPEMYRTPMEDEHAEPGFYAARLPGLHLRVSATASERAGITRFEAETDGDVFILLDAGRSLSLLGGGSVAWLDTTLLEGLNRGGGFCGEANRHDIFFSVRISATPLARGTWIDSTIFPDPAASADGRPVGAWLRLSLKQGESVEVRTGISYVSTQNARLNRETEIGDTPFDEVRAESRQAWNTVLNRVRPHGGSREARVKLFTALYHSCIHPNIIDDVNGEFPRMRRQGIGTYRQRNRYTVFSLWDTYRTLHPLLTLLYPERQTAIVQTMLDMYTESGWLPKWELGGNETSMMVGDPAVPVIADSYMKGLRSVDTAAVFAALWKGTTPGADSIRPGYDDMVRLGFIPVDQDTSQTWWTWGPVSTMLEYCVADWSAARVADAMGKQKQAGTLDRRSGLYVNLFDHETGFLRPRLRNGSWLVPFNPLATEGSGSWEGSGGPGYVEGNAWTYTWFVPHDVAGLANLFGSTDRCASKLDSCFRLNHFTINNEPDIAYPYLFTYFPGWEHRTQEIVDNLCRTAFGIGPDGLPGNDDAGAISAWFVFSALGIYPACPASNEYRLGVPLFESVELDLMDQHGGQHTLRIHKAIRPDSPVTGAAAIWNGTPLPVPAVRHEQLVQGGTLEFLIPGDRRQ
ncbi:MAG: GH92 family glycosyl hydrolase [Bacteroidetes bacterium]|nr:GH92 family glycosyl hydrolase [Bacteroidota bacterium]